MKRVFIIVLAACLCFCLAACGGAPKDDEIKTVRNVSFEGTELTVTLGTNKSTGYEWDFEIFGDCIEQSINKSFKVTGSQGDATGEVSIGFEGTVEGEVVILFTTPNGWDGTGAGDAYTVNVSVNADGTIKNALGANGNNAPQSTPEPTAEPTTAPTAAPTDDAQKQLSATYAEMLKSGDYQYTYSLTYEGKAYKATIAAKHGMYCRSVISDDGSYSARVVTIDGKAWQIDDLTGATAEMSAEEAAAEVHADFSSLTFAGANTLETGYIAEAYDFEYQGAKCNIVFVLSPDGELVMLVPTIGENTTQMEITEMKAPAYEALFEAPETAEQAKVLWSNYNSSRVQNSAKEEYIAVELPACTVTQIETYHYFSDGKAPGTISIYSEDDVGYGTFQAKGKDGQGGVKNASWVAEAGVELPAGTYYIVDSDPSTWSNNSESGGLGFCMIIGIAK